MSSVSLNLTEDEVEEARESGSSMDSEPVPNGTYDAVIFDVEKNLTNDEYYFDGGEEKRQAEYLDVQFRIDSGEHEDRRVFDIFMLETPDKYPDGSNVDNIWHDGTIELFDAVNRTDQLLAGEEIQLDSLFGEEVVIDTYVQESDEYGDSASVGSVLPPDEESSDEPDDTFIPE